MGYTVKDADLLDTPLAERNLVLGELVTAAKAPRNGQALAINARIRQYELRYEMSSERLLVALANKEQRETAEIADWLFWLATRDNLENGHQARA